MCLLWHGSQLQAYLSSPCLCMRRFLLFIVILDGIHVFQYLLSPLLCT